MTELSEEQKSAILSPAYWCALGKIRLANGQPFNLEREYQHAWLETPQTARERCYMKATGAGVSDAEILESIHGMIYGRYPQGVLYGFPTDDDMYDYSKTRWDPLIRLNPLQIGQYLGQGRKKTDSADVKRIGTANLYLRGMRMQPTADGESRQSVAATGIHVDKVVLDEVDQMEVEIIGKVRGRLSNARIEGIPGKSYLVMIGNPSDEDRGIDSLWQASDQRYWFRRCTCGHWTSAEIFFWNDPERAVGFYPDATERRAAFKPLGYIRCEKCEAPLPVGGCSPDGRHAGGEWRPTRENTEREGYHWSYLSSYNQDPAHVLQCYRNPPEGNLGDVIRLMLGRAYSSVDERLRKANILACCDTTQGIPDVDPGPAALGCDNDDHKHYVILQRTGNERYKLVRPGVADSPGEVLDLIKRYGIKTGVMDLRPNADSARDFQKAALRLGCRVWLCEYTDSPLQDATYNDLTGIIKAYRTGIFDVTHKIFMNQSITLPRRSTLLEQFAEQCCNCVKSKEIDKRRRTETYRYKKTGGGNDHWRNALNYGVMAANKIPPVRPGKQKSFEKNDCIMEFS